MRKFLVGGAALALLCAAANAAIINEFVVNHVGTDTNEFLEVYDLPNTDLSALRIIQIEGDGTGTGVIDSIDVVGTTNASGFWVSAYFNNRIENGTISLLLVSGFSGSTGTDLDTNNDGILDSTPWTAILDGVGVNDGGSGDQTYGGATALLPNFDGDPNIPGGASRIPNGTDTNSVSDWKRNDFDGAGLPGFTGTPIAGEAYNTPGTTNSAVPEPASLLLLGLGGLTLLRNRRA